MKKKVIIISILFFLIEIIYSIKGNAATYDTVKFYNNNLIVGSKVATVSVNRRYKRSISNREVALLNRGIDEIYNKSGKETLQNYLMNEKFTSYNKINIRK